MAEPADGVNKPAAGADLTLLVHHPHADRYARLVGDRFPNVRTIVAPDRDTVEQHIDEADALLAFRFPIEAFDRARKLRWFQCTGAGVDSLLPIRDRLGDITVTNARGIHGELIADYVMAGVTMLHWDFRGLLREQAEKKWNPRQVSPLAESTLGVVGLGSIGTTVARRAKSAAMTVVGTRRDVSRPVDGVDEVFGSDQLARMLPRCDFVVLAVPATPETAGLIGAAELACMKPTAFLVNIARGGVVAEAELVAALQAGTIAGAMLDVFEEEPLPVQSPLWSMPNVLVTPHISGMASNYVERVFTVLADNIDRFLAGRPLTNVVDLARGY